MDQESLCFRSRLLVPQVLLFGMTYPTFVDGETGSGRIKMADSLHTHLVSSDSSYAESQIPFS
jgi:hypothetical protein